MFRIAIIGSKTCFKTKKVKEFLYKVKTTFGSTATILSGGNQEGIERDVKKFAIEFQIPYQEFNPSFSGKNLYSALSDEYYTKGYHASHFGHRYECMLSRTDKLIIGESEDSKDWKFYQGIAKKAEKKGIPVIFI